MRALWPQSLAGRLIIWLMLVFMLALIVALTLYRLSNERLLANAAQKDAVNRVVMLSRILEEQKKSTDWQQTLHAATSDDLRFSFSLQDNDVKVVDHSTAHVQDEHTTHRLYGSMEKKPKESAYSREFTVIIPSIKPAIKGSVKEKVWIIERQVGQNTPRDFTGVSKMEVIENQLQSQFKTQRVISFSQQEQQGIAIFDSATTERSNKDVIKAIFKARKTKPDIARFGTVKFRTKLDDGRWLNAAFKPETLPLWSWNGALFLGVLALAIGGVIVLVVRNETRPMQHLAEAAEALGRGEHLPPLQENGPREVRLAVEAFNLMGARLGNFVQDRTRMLAAMSHDLRTPLTTLRLRAEMIDEPEAREKLIETIEEMHRITEASLSFAREEDNTEETRETDLSALVSDLCEEAKAMGRDASMKTQTLALNARVRPAAMRRAVRNLIDNAVRYGTHARIAIEADKKEARIIIEDDGPGIDEAQLEDVFAPFVRLEHSRNAETGGAGLGLSIARTIARSHGGDVVLHNRKSGGLRATLSVPG